MGFFSKLFKSVTNLLGEVLGFLVGADFDDQSQAEGVLVNKSSNIANIPVIYGTRKVGGTRVFLSTGGNDNKYLYMALVLCEGEIDSIGDVFINDTISTDSKYSGLVTIDKKLGTDDQTYSTVLAGATDTWGANHRLRGIAYLGLRLEYNQDAFGSIPDIKCIVNGRKVYDPRDLNQSFSDPTTWTFSKNPALCLRDYLSNNRFGKGLSASQINDTSIIAAANVCDITVAEYDGQGAGTIPLLQANAVIDTNKKLFDNVKILLQGMRGLMPFQDGKYTLLIDAAAPAGTPFRLDNSNITSEIQVTSSGKNKKYNRVRAKFVNPEANWQEDSVDWPPNDSTYTGFLAEDNGEELLRNVTLNTITNYYSARDIARIICRASREHQLTVELTALPEALSIAVGDVVELEHDSLGWTGSAIQDMRVLSMGLQESGEVKLTLQEYTNVYTWQEGAEEGENTETTIPNPFSVEPPEALSLTQGVNVAEDGSNIPYLDVAFTAAEDAFVVEYIINISPSGFDPSEVRMTTASLTAAQVAGTDKIKYLINPALVTTYTVEVWAVNDAGVRSTSISANISVTGDVTPPSAVTSLTASGGYRAISVKWTNPSNDDYSWAEVKRRVYNTGVYVKIASVFGKPSDSSQYLDGGLQDNNRYQYQVTAYDWSNNAATTSPTTDAYTDDLGEIVTNELEPRADSGYLYKQTPTADTVTSVATPSASNYNWTTGVFGTLSSDWSHDPPDVNPIGTAGAGLKYWSARYYVTESVYNGTEQVSVSTPFNSFLFDGLVTFSNLNTELGDANTTLITTVDGGLIQTGTVDLVGDNVAGMAIKLGKNSYSDDANDGFWLGNTNTSSNPLPQLNIGDTENYLKWDGETLVSTGLRIESPDGDLVMDSRGTALENTGSILPNSALQGVKDQGITYVTNTDYEEIIPFWQTAPDSAGNTNNSQATDTWWANKNLFQLRGQTSIQTSNYIPVKEDENLYLSIDNYMNATSISNMNWFVVVRFYDQNKNWLNGFNIQRTASQNAADRWGDTYPWSGAGRKISTCTITVPSNTNNNPITYCQVRIDGNTSNSLASSYYANIYNVYLGRIPQQITSQVIETYIKNLAVDTLKIADNAVTVPASIQYGSNASYFSNGVDTVVNSTALGVSFGTNIPGKVIMLALCDLGYSALGGDWAAAVLRLRYNTTNSTTIGGSVIVQGVQVNSRKGAPPSLMLNNTINGWSGTRYFFLTVEVTGETVSATGWWRVEDANISMIGAKK